MLGLLGTNPELQPSIVFTIFGWPVTSSLMMIWFVMLLIIVFVIVLNVSLKLIPGKVQNIFEMLYTAMVNLIDQITRNRAISEKITPLIAALFLFIGLSNVVSFIPGLTSIEFNGHEVFRSPTSDFNTTFALALGMILLIQVQSMRDWGIFGYVGRFIKIKEVFLGFRQGIGPGMNAFIEFLIGLLDIVSELARIISLSFRLFGNIYAGEILMVVILGALAYGLPAVWMGMSAFTGLIQALVFGALATAYYAGAMKEDDVA